MSPFLSRLVSYLLNLVNKHVTTLILAYIPTHTIPMASSSHSLSGILILGSTGDIFVGIFKYKSMSALLHPGKFATSGSLRVGHFQPSLEVSAELYTSPSSMSSPSSVQVSIRTDHKSIQTFILASPCLIEAPWLPTVLNMLSHHKRSHEGYIGRPGSQAYAITAFNSLATKRCVIQTRVLFLSLSGSAVGAQMSIKRFASNLGENWQFGVIRKVYQTMAFLPLN